ncbi:hypothetical protein RHS04_09350 [Rhizoctonia solani]|uniref:Uncharacterized protein n=1 Tax=Rhizoctonia solani TaxID=456999 RepID=A0A8H7H0D4_9AGAM|nr:hypothetical protein RHS04_09350 [Rhizoctonia solani]
MSQYPHPSYHGGPPEFIHPNPSGQGITPNPTLGIPLGPVAPLEMIEQALNPLFVVARETSESVKIVVKEVADLNLRLNAIESRVKSLSEDAGEDGDDESDSASERNVTHRSRKRARTSTSTPRRTSQRADKPEKPKGKVLNVMKAIREEILYKGCDATKMDDLKPALTNDEDLRLKERIRGGSEEAWRPNFMLPVEHEANKFYVEIIVEECLKSTTAKKKIEENRLPSDFWTRGHILDPVLKDLWATARRSVKKALDPAVQAKAEQQNKSTTRAGRRERLCKNRRRIAEGDEKHPEFVYTSNNGQSKTIPGQLIIEEATSDVLSCDEDRDVGGIRPDLAVEAYQEARKPFKYEGIPPFWRHAMWTEINNALDSAMRFRGVSLQPRYYASPENRGQRVVSEVSKVYDIPPGLYRCHISDAWFARMTPAQKSGVKPSPPGWEVEGEGGSNGIGGPRVSV